MSKPTGRELLAGLLGMVAEWLLDEDGDDPADPEASEGEGDEDAPGTKTYVMFADSSAEDVLDLMVLLRLKHEGTLGCTLDDITDWCGMKSSDVQHYWHSGAWKFFWERCSFTTKERRTMYSAVLYLLNCDREKPIAETVKKLVAAAMMRSLRKGVEGLDTGDEEEDTGAADTLLREQKTQKAITDRYYYAMVMQSRMHSDNTAD